MNNEKSAIPENLFNNHFSKKLHLQHQNLLN